MPKLKNVPDHVIFRISAGEKNRLLLLAAQARHAELLALQKENQKMLYIIVRLVLFSASAEQRHAEEDVIKFYQSTSEKAEKIYGEKE